MTCFRPIVAFVVGQNEKGKKQLKFVTKDNYRQEIYYDDRGNPHPEYERLLLSCGKCIGCKMDRSREWSVRLMLEYKYHECASFITLTYNDEYLPLEKYIDDDGCEAYAHPLVKEHLQKFMKRLRKHYSDKKIRFFACGEYGELNKRPHYHVILFGVDFSEDRYVHATTEDGFVQYRSPTLEKLWKYGYSMICEVNLNTCAYVARYCVKKRYQHNMDYQTFKLVPEFNVMSRRPGIGYQWFMDNYENIYPDKYIYMSTDKGGQKFKPPRYFDKLLEIEDESLHNTIKEQRKEIAKLNVETITRGGELDYFEMLLAKEREFTARTKSLLREKV